MKKIKTYKVFNESLKDKLKGKSEDDIMNSLEGLSDSSKIEAIIRHKLPHHLLPDELVYDGYLDLSFTELEELPDGLVVNGKLDLTDNQSFTSLPNGLVVNGWLDCSHTALSNLPENLIVTHTLYCEDTPLLPDTISKPKGVNKLIIRDEEN